MASEKQQAAPRNVKKAQNELRAETEAAGAARWRR